MQAKFLGHWSSGITLERMIATSATNAEIVEALKKVMIRHTKAQRIRGEVALALPDADVDTCWLEMSKEERVLYDLHACAAATART